MSQLSDSAIRIQIIEDNRQYTGSLKNMIELTSDMEFVANFVSAEAYLSGSKETIKDLTNLVILDLHLPGKSGLQLIPTLKKEMPESRILVLTQDSDYHTTLEAIKLGISGYLLKKSPITAIREAIREVHAGGCIIDPKLSKLVLDALGGDSTQNDATVLTARECQVLELLSMGYVKKEVAERMSVSYSSITQYTESIYKKLQVPNAAAAIAAAIRKGLIQ